VSAFFISCAKPAVSRPTVLVRCARSSATEISASRRCRVQAEATPPAARISTSRYCRPPRLIPFQSEITSAIVESRKTIGPQYSAATAMRRARKAARIPGELGRRFCTRAI
jgi:hypothetical protein